MKQKFFSLSTYFKTVIISLIVLTVILLGIMVLFFYGYMDIPLGIAIGCLLNVLFYIIIGIIEKKKENNSIKLVVVNAIRLLAIAGLLFLSGWLYYSKNIHLFNLFGECGGYLLPLIILLIFTLKERKAE